MPLKCLNTLMPVKNRSAIPKIKKPIIKRIDESIKPPTFCPKVTLPAVEPVCKGDTDFSQGQEDRLNSKL